jgi:invasion protein IalB
LVLIHRRIGFAETRAGRWLAAVVLVGASMACAAPVLAQIPEGGTIKAQHGDWQVVCKPPPRGAKNEICGIVQTVTAEDNDNVGLTVIVQRFSDGKLVLRVVAPLGVFLGKALGVQIDNGSQDFVPFARCLPIGCQAQADLDSALIAKMNSGKTMMFIVYRTQEVGIGIPISLAGFSQALAALP